MPQKNHTNGKTYLKHLNYKDFRIIFNNKLSPKYVYQTLQQDLLTLLPKCTSQLFCSFLSLPFLLHLFFLMVGKSVKFRSSQVDTAQTIPILFIPRASHASSPLCQICSHDLCSVTGLHTCLILRWGSSWRTGQRQWFSLLPLEGLFQAISRVTVNWLIGG